MRQSTDQTVLHTIEVVKGKAPLSRERHGYYIWYDVKDQGLSAEVTLLRQAGVIEHHPTIRTLIRFSDERVS